MELYIHVPFCRQKCRYCDFASFAGREKQMEAYVSAVLQEASLRAETLGAQSVETVFVGGGTPSTLPPELLTRLLTGIFAFFPPTRDAEFTLECNPGTLTAAWLDAARKCGANRLSMGMQALQPELLHTLGRIHTFAQVQSSVALARAAGFDDLNLDLMFGLPRQTRRQWHDTLNAALSLAPTHLSCYGLIPEECTPLGDDILCGRIETPSEDDERAMYDEALTRLAQAGFEHYEISNFALHGKACRHNLGYWRQTPYLGLGVSAASMLLARDPAFFCTRTTNPATLDAYLASAASGFPPAETENVTRKAARFETLMLGLRTMAGVREDDFARMHGVSLESVYGARLHGQEAQGLLAHDDGRWYLTRRGMDVQNAILVELMDEDD